MAPYLVLLGVLLVGVIAFVAGAVLTRTRDLEEVAYRLTDLTPPQGVEECVCGRQIAAGGPEHHMVGVRFADDAKLAGGPVEGGTGMVADFCPKHCPGGCNRGCPRLEVVA